MFMTYNIHPIFVHFPVAFLLLYSFIKIMPFYKWFPKVSWKQIQIVLLVAGVIGAFVANSTGEIAEHLANPNHDLVEMHATFASISTWVYGLLLIGELLALLNLKIIPQISEKIGVPKMASFLMFIQKILTNRTLSIILALVGLVAISVTGLLGGVMVYGTTADPIAPFVLRLLGL
jgi:uncharacterized membrane protein